MAHVQFRQRVTDARLCLKAAAEAHADYTLAFKTMGRPYALANWWEPYRRAADADKAAQDDLRETQDCALERLGLIIGGLT